MDNSDFLVAILIESIGAFIGAYLGFRLGLNLNKRNRIEEDVENKRMLLDSLLVEIDYNITMMKIGLKKT